MTTGIVAKTLTCGCGAVLTRDESSANGWRDEHRDLWCENGNLHAPATPADLFPFACEWCKNTPATHLLITDVQRRGTQVAERHEAKICAAHAHEPTVLPPEFVGWWLFELVPDHCEDQKN